ncbi:similarity to HYPOTHETICAL TRANSMEMBRANE PROTEINS YHG4_yeast [Encephalitozoon cuniculi GB-M1]|uniref:RNA polymerase II subunit A C-terminal domain phosphatase n=2 Tax=Encephalitozoon cuniculi TaxID=6035 RepID=FCP1_ENCCU|nr:protein serine/threonine phosphatase [Encephalitozoon cuniculi GB-M1]Q8SV03.1 RecName: Full=RNA polymerase II subunit A C-terminal domain phosphatase; AltName: Full=CTD phosphatase FCP1 [Encephalitozoon cuniculi GB-M1]AGE95809.1 hypothetical protein ECU07_0890 [Encephalitozoon cuniculi]KMV65813.1 TFIIF-interacting CTD phosphatase [Encephalitozoon cuniculi EcunIII-L]UYI27248.1 RNA polymerase II subunit A C-terminal domain phosphatase [Encephalitozoon cuniculi]CAD25621.1 similarity to HYPOTHE
MGGCNHPIRLGTLCGVCGMEIQEESHLFCALYNTDNVKITHEEAVAIHKEKMEALEMQMKLILVLDLDQTVLHTTYGTSSLEGTVKFVIDRCRYCVKLRPNLDYMLRRISKLYEIHVYTMGTRAYAERIVEIIDPSGKYFDDRIITRDENQGVLVKRLSRLFPHDHRNIVILDDRPDVWDYCENLVLIRPFWYFNRVDINDPLRLKRKIEKEAGENKALEEFVSKRKKIEDIRNPEIASRLDDMVLESSCGSEGVEDDSRSTEEKEVSEVQSVASGDSELLKVAGFLRKVHRKYFASKQRNVKRILRKIRRRVFGGDRFFVAEIANRAWLVKTIEMYGGIVGIPESGVDFVVSSCEREAEYLAQKFECLAVSPKWIADCVYSLKRVEYGKYVVCDHRTKDEYEEELERLFT